MRAAIPLHHRGFLIVLAFQFAGLAGHAHGGQPLPAPVPSRQVATPIDSGVVENTGPAPAIVFVTTIEVPDALWLRLAFSDVVLAGSEADGTASYLLLTSLVDGAHQVLYARHLVEWGNTSAYFNGDAVQVDLLASPGTGPNRLVISETTAGIRPVEPRSICGPTDDRILSSDPRAGRVMPIGCTGWMIGDANHCLLTAGHCISNGSSGVVMEFNVPLSGSGGAVNHPPPEDQYAVDPVSIQSNGGGGVGNDWAYFGCFPNPITGLTPFQGQGGSYFLTAPPAVSGQTIRITGYGTTSSPVSPTWNQVQKTHTGPYYSFSGTTVRYVVDTTGGNSGSPVINDDTGFAIGIHTHGGCSSGANNGTGSNHSGLQNALANPLGVCALVAPLFVFPDGVPGVVHPGGGTTFRVEAMDQGGLLPQPDTGLLYTDVGGGYQSVAMVEVSPNVYDAVFPPSPCGSVVRYYVSALAIGGLEFFGPPDAPVVTYEAVSSSSPAPFADFDFETAAGWTVENTALLGGEWERGVPAGGGDRGDPAEDYDKSGQCFLTENVDGNSDVDGGPTRLTSPAFDLTSAAGPVLSYARWFTNDPVDQDRLDVEISDDDGATWTLIESVPHTVGWVVQTVQVASYVNLTAEVRVRFSTEDVPNNSITESAIDAFSIYDCDAGVVCTKGDANQDGFVNGSDIEAFTDLMIFGATPGTIEFCTADMDDNGVLDGDQDVLLMVSCLLGGPCR